MSPNTRAGDMNHYILETSNLDKQSNVLSQVEKSQERRPDLSVQQTSNVVSCH